MNFEHLLSDSYERLIGLDGNGEIFFSEFYQQFLSSSPKIVDTFKHTDMKKQRKMLKKSLYHVLNFFIRNRDSEYIRAIASHHSKKHLNITPELYDFWLEALVATIEKLDPKYNRDVGLAWKMIMGMGVMYMKDMYDREDVA